MTILGISCSPRKGKNTEILVNEALRGAQEEGAEADLYSVVGKTITPCDGCWSCRKTKKCHIDDDMQELYEKMKAADGIVFGTPVYFFDVSSQAKLVIDRSLAFQPFGEPLGSKVGGVVIAAGSSGTSDTVKTFQMYFTTHRIFLVNWVAVYSPVKDKPKGMEAAFDLGREMVLFFQTKSQFISDFPPRHSTFGTHKD